MTKKKDICFVIMPFDKKLKKVYTKAIKRAAVTQGYQCIRADEITGAGNILRHIVEYLNKAKIVIADLTDKNANVLYELGLAHALGKHVLILAQSIQNDIPFDLDKYRVIQYNMGFEDENDLFDLHDTLCEALEKLDEWTREPTNPVHDFLPPRVDSEEYQKMVEESNQLKNENTKLSGMVELADSFFDRLGGQLSEQIDLEKMYDRFTNVLEEDESITVPVQSSGTRKKLVFTKVENPSKMKRTKA